MLVSKTKQKKELRYYLASCGWQEIITYSLISLTSKEEFRENQNETFYRLAMPKSENHEYYRYNLLPSHLEVIKYNLAYGNRDLFFFEISTVYNPSNPQSEELLVLSGKGKILDQSLHQLVHKVDFYWVKGVLENIFWRWRIDSQINFEPALANYLSSSQSAEIFLNQQKIGFVGQINPLILQKYRINEPVFATQISLTKIFAYLEKFLVPAFYQPLSNFPRSEKDLSFIFPIVTNYQQVIKTMKNLGGENLRESKFSMSIKILN